MRVLGFLFAMIPLALGLIFYMVEQLVKGPHVMSVACFGFAALMVLIVLPWTLTFALLLILVLLFITRRAWQ